MVTPPPQYTGSVLHNCECVPYSCMYTCVLSSSSMQMPLAVLKIDHTLLTMYTCILVSSAIWQHVLCNTRLVQPTWGPPVNSSMPIL